MVLATSTDDVKGISPDAITALITDPIDKGSVAIQAATLITTASTRTHLPVVAADPSADWVAEGDEIGASDPTVDDIVVTPGKLAGLTIITNELAADTSPAAADIVGNGLARDIIRRLDGAFFGTRGFSTVQPAGIEDVVGISQVEAGAAWGNLDAFAEAIANADALGLSVGAFVANPADALVLAKLKDESGSNRPLLGIDATAPTKRNVLGVRLLTSPGVRVGSVWGIPRERAFVVRRQDVTLAVDRSAYFTSDRTAIKATLRVGFGFPHPAALQRVLLSSTANPTVTAASPSAAATGATVTLTGTNFVGTKSVTIGGVPAPVFTVVSATSLTVVVPPGAAGSAPIVVTNNRGATSAFAYTRG